jgi:hypothetical protein
VIRTWTDIYAFHVRLDMHDARKLHVGPYRHHHRLLFALQLEEHSAVAGPPFRRQIDDASAPVPVNAVFHGLLRREVALPEKFPFPVGRLGGQCREQRGE